MTEELVPCLKLPDGCLLVLQSFSLTSDEQQAASETGRAIFYSTDQLECLEGKVVLARITS